MGNVKILFQTGERQLCLFPTGICILEQGRLLKEVCKVLGSSVVASAKKRKQGEHKCGSEADYERGRAGKAATWLIWERYSQALLLAKPDLTHG